MANNFDTVKLKAASEKFNLIRIEPARSVEGSLTLLSGTTYTVTFAFTPVSQIIVDGVQYSKVDSSPSSGEYSFDENTKLITINLGAALTTQVVVVFYYLFFTKNIFRNAPETPTDTNATNRGWTPRISREPSFSFNLSDVTEGFLSFGASSIELHNEDGFFEQYVGNNDSFSNKNITIWLALDNVENVRLVYRGFVNRLTIGKKVTVEYFDEYSILNKTFFSNGTYLKSTFNSTKFTNMHPAKENAPIHKLFAEVSTYRVIDEGTASGLHRVDHERLLEAHCVNFSTTISTSNNRDWGTILSEGDAGVQTDTVGSIDHSDPNFSLIGFSNGKKYRIGDTLHFGGSKYVRVLFVDNGADTMKTTKDATIAVSDTITRSGISCVVIRQSDVNYFALFGRDYTVSVSGEVNDIIKLSFTTSAESNLGIPNPINPDQDIVRFRAWAKTNISTLHGDVMKELLESAGLAVNTASITAANATTLNTNFYVPFFNQTVFTSYADIIQKLLSSTLGFISLNNDLEILYSLFSLPSTSDEVTDRQILLNSFKTVVEYNDLRDSIIPENDHDIIELDFVNAGLENSRTTYLHEVSKEKTYKHLLDTTDRMQKILDFVSERKASFQFEFKTAPDVIVGDQFKISRSKLIGNTSDRSITTVNISKSATKVTLSGYDLLGL